MAEKKDLVRFGVSFPEPLIEQFDRYIGEQGYTNRSEAFRDMARKMMLEPNQINSDTNVAGTIVMVYDHQIQELPIILMDIQHQFHHEVISTMHVHLSYTQCLEIIVVRGKLSNLRALHQQIQVQKGVHYAEISVTYMDEESSSSHHHN